MVFIISASGMCESGRVLHHLRNSVGGPSRGVFLVHGEPEQQEPLRATLTADGLRVRVPARGELVQLD